MTSEAERLIVTMHYSGKYKRFNFERYVQIQKNQHHILQGLKEHGNMRIDTRSQVRHFNQGIRIAEFDAVKDQIMATASFRIYYNGCVSLYKTLINKSKKVSPPELNMSGVESYNHKGGGQKKVPYIPPWNSTHLQQPLHFRPCISSILLLCG